jgi:hypothetical protein
MEGPRQVKGCFLDVITEVGDRVSEELPRDLTEKNCCSVGLTQSMLGWVRISISYLGLLAQRMVTKLARTTTFCLFLYSIISTNLALPGCEEIWQSICCPALRKYEVLTSWQRQRHTTLKKHA